MRTSIRGFIIALVAVSSCYKSEQEKRHEEFVAEVGEENAHYFEELDDLYRSVMGRCQNGENYLTDITARLLEQRNRIRYEVAQVMSTERIGALSYHLRCLAESDWVWACNRGISPRCYEGIVENGYVVPAPGASPMYDLIYRNDPTARRTR